MSDYSNKDCEGFPEIVGIKKVYCDLCSKNTECIRLIFSYCEEYGCYSDFCEDCLKRMLKELSQ